MTHAVPSKEANPNGLHSRYVVYKRGGEDDPNAVYFVLRLDNGGNKKWAELCRQAAQHLAILMQGEYPEESEMFRVASELDDLVSKLSRED